jgi:hypothetical protein
MRTHYTLAILLPLLVAASASAADKVTVNLADPQATLNTFFEAQKANDLPTLSKLFYVSNPDKKNYANNILTFQLWSRYLERQAIARFGKEEGIRAQGHLRSLDDQSDLDIKRARDAGIEYNAEKNAVHAFLRVERGRPENLQTDRFTFLDEYYLVKTTDGWQIDFLKTYKCLDPEQEETYKAETAAYARMSLNLTRLSKEVKAGQFKTADDLKNVLDQMWAQVYDAPVDASGHTAAETQAAEKAAEKAAAQAATKPAE